jgi:hypothetical protein
VGAESAFLRGVIRGQRHLFFVKLFTLTRLFSASLTTNGMAGRLHRQGKQLAHPWLLDSQGNSSRDPAGQSRSPETTFALAMYGQLRQRPSFLI